MLCDYCKKNQATFHLKQITGSGTVVTHLCPECAKQLEMPISFDNLFQGFLDSFFQYMPNTGQGCPTEDTVKCPVCGTTYSDFKSTSRLGCAKCYETFEKEFSSIFKNIQGSNTHQGKIPKKAGAEMLYRRNLEAMRQKLRDAIEKEEFEAAARLRDEIKEYERSPING